MQCAFPTTTTFSSTTTTKPSISGNEHLIHAAFAPGHYSKFTQSPSVVIYSQGSQLRITECFKLLCLFMCVCVCVCVCVLIHAKSFQSCLTLCDAMDSSLPGCPGHEDSPGKNTGVSCPSVLQGIFPTQGLNPCLLHPMHWRVDSLSLRHLESLLYLFSLLYSKTLSSVFPWFSWPWWFLRLQAVYFG